MALTLTVTDEPKAGDYDTFTQRGFDQTQALQSDRRQHGEHCDLVLNCIRNARHEVLRHAHHFGMLAIAGDPIAHRQPFYPGPDLDYDPDIAVAQR